jgi:hypothetical protein
MLEKHSNTFIVLHVFINKYGGEMIIRLTEVVTEVYWKLEFFYV